MILRLLQLNCQLFGLDDRVSLEGVYALFDIWVEDTQL